MMEVAEMKSLIYKGEKPVSNYLFYIRKRLSGQKVMRLLNIVVASLALALLCAAVTIPQILLHCENTIQRALGDDMSRYGVIRDGRGEVSEEILSHYSSDIYNAPEIDSVGTWDYGGFSHLETANYDTDYWQQIQDIQNSHVKEFGDDNYVQFVYMLSQAFHINHLELYHGSTEQIGKNTEYLMYLGYNFKDIPIGTVFVNETYGFSYVVEGIFQKNTSIVDEQDILWNLNDLKLSCSIAMDNMVLIVPPCSYNYHSVDYFFKCADGYTYEDAAARIKSIAEEYGIRTETGRLQDRVDTILSDSNWLLAVIVKLSVLSVFSALIILLTAQLLTILSRKDELGVWLISGISKKKIFMILFGENLVKMLISSVIAFGIVVFFEKIMILSKSIAYELRYILWGNIPICLLFCTVLMTLLCSVIPIAYVRQKSIPEIVRGTWD